ncbi:MAG: hypothetical protein ABEJ55_04145, partial [Halanaeroarchaeum sp.]
MEYDIDGATILYALGVAFAIGALLYFARDVVFDLSLTVKALLLFVAFLAFLVLGMALERRDLAVVAYALAGVAYAVFLGYVILRFDLGATRAFLLLAASAVLFIALGYGVGERGVALAGRRSVAILGVLLLVSVLLVGADVATAGVSFDAEFAEEATVTAPDDRPPEADVVPGTARVGTVAVTNPGPFARTYELPRVESCLVGVDDVAPRDVSVFYSGYVRSHRIGGGGTQRFAVRARLPLRNGTESMTVAVERGDDCSAPSRQPTLYVSFPEDDVAVTDE